MDPQQGTVLIGVVLVAVDLAIRIAALIIIPRERKPTAAMAWLLAILLVPYLGTAPDRFARLTSAQQ